MEQKQTWNNCKLSGRDECIHRDEESIRKLASNEAMVDSIDSLGPDPNPITSSMITEADQICNSCEGFQPRATQNS